MNKRVLLLGILFIVIGFFVSGLSVSTTLPLHSASSSTGRIVVGSESSAYVPIQINQSSLPMFFFNSSSMLGFVFANSTAFAILSKLPASSLIKTAESLEGRGVLEIANSTSSVFPYVAYPNSSIQAGIARPIYQGNVSLLPAGNYYAIFSNPGNVSVNASYRFSNFAYSSKLSSEISSVSPYIFASSLIVFLGFVLIAVSLFMKGKSKQAAESDEDRAAQEIYAKLEKKRHKRSKQISNKERRIRK